MSASAPAQSLQVDLESISHRNNLKLLFWLRNIAVTGQLLAVSLALSLLSLPLPWQPMLAVIFLLVVVNVFTGIRIWNPSGRLIHPKEVFLQLMIDVIALITLIFFSGGISNPFIGLFILQVVIAAILLPPKQTWAIVAITVVAYCFLSYYNVPLAGLSHGANHGMSDQVNALDMNAHDDHHGMHHHDEASSDASGVMLSGFDLHLHGMLLGYVITAVLVALFVVRMAKNSRDRDKELSRIQQQALSESEIMKLGMLAAGAAHELGTPLNAIRLISDELNEDLVDDQRFSKRLAILDRQVRRCSNSLNDLMTVVRQPRALDASNVGVNQFLSNVAEEWQHLNPQIELQLDLSFSSDKEFVADKVLVQCLINLLDNAARVSQQKIRLKTQKSMSLPSGLAFVIEDEGEGVPESIQAMLGENQPVIDESGQVRLGLFLANVLVQRLGGILTFKSAQKDSDSSSVIIELPLTTAHV